MQYDEYLRKPAIELRQHSWEWLVKIDTAAKILRPHVEHSSEHWSCEHALQWQTLQNALGQVQSIRDDIVHGWRDADMGPKPDNIVSAFLDIPDVTEMNRLVHAAVTHEPQSEPRSDTRSPAPSRSSEAERKNKEQKALVRMKQARPLISEVAQWGAQNSCPPSACCCTSA